MSPTQITGGLYIGDIDDVREGDTSRFDRVIGVCQDDCSANVGCEYEHFNLADGPEGMEGHVPGEYSYELLSEAIDRTVAARIARDTVLVHCHVGRSRSATVVTAALATLEGLTWDEAFNRVKDKRPIVNPGQTLREDGQRYVGEMND